MAKKQKHLKFGVESVMRLLVFAVLMFLAIGYLSNSKSNLKIPTLDSKILGDYSPKIGQGQKWLEVEFNRLKEQVINQFFDKIKSSILK